MTPVRVVLVNPSSRQGLLERFVMFWVLSPSPLLRSPPSWHDQDGSTTTRSHPLSLLLFPSFGLRENCVRKCVNFIPIPLISQPPARKSGSALLLLSHRTRSVTPCYPHRGLFLRCSLVFGAAFALKILVRFASFRNIWLTEARLDYLAISLDPCAFGIHRILSIFLL